MSRYCTTRTDSLCFGQLPHHWEAPTVRTYSSSGLLYELVSPHPGDEAEEKLKKTNTQSSLLAIPGWHLVPLSEKRLILHQIDILTILAEYLPISIYALGWNEALWSKVACTKIQYKDKVYSWTVRPLELTVWETGAAIWQNLVADNLLIFISCLLDIICVHLEQKDNHSERELTLNFLSRKRSVLPVSLS